MDSRFTDDEFQQTRRACNRALWFFIAATLAFVFVVFTFPAGAQVSPGRVMPPGATTPDDGVFFSGQSVIDLLEDYRDLESLKEQDAARTQELEQKDAQIKGLTAALEAAEKSVEKMEQAVQKAEYIIQNWERIETARISITKEYQEALKAERAENDRLRKSARWNGLLGIGAVVVGVIAGIF